MKACPFCAEDIQDAAIVCRHCGRDLKTGTLGSPPPKKTTLGTKLVAGVFLLLFLGWCSSLINNQVPSSTRSTASQVDGGAPSKPAPAPQPVLALLSSRGYQSDGGGYWYVEGEVKNLSSQPIKSVQAVSTWYDKADGFIASDNAMIEYDPLLPGQTSPYKTITRGNPAMSKYSVSFKRIFGGELQTRDDRKNK